MADKKAPTAGQLAKALGVSTRRVAEMYVEGMPRDLAGARRWHQGRKKKLQDDRTGPLQDARRRKTEADAQLAELALKTRLGELVTVQDAAAETERILDRLRARILAVPGKFAPRIMGKTTMAEAMLALEAVTADLMADLVSTADE